MIRFRSFRNSDPPAIARLWSQQPPLRTLVQPLTIPLFEQRVLNRPYFDQHGLIIAEQEGRIVGFAHAGLGADACGTTLTTDRGTTCMLMVDPPHQASQLGSELLDCSERYLRARGTRCLLAGNIAPTNPFYLGLYGDGISPGLLESDAWRVGLFTAAGYQPTCRHPVWERQLRDFRPLVDRSQMQLRRQYRVEVDDEPVETSWWEACTLEPLPRLRYRLVSRRGGQSVGSAIFWGRLVGNRLMPQAVGLLELQIEPSCRRRGLGTFLLGETLRRMPRNEATEPSEWTGIQTCSVQLEETNQAAAALLRKLGFQPVDCGLVLEKSASEPA